MPTELFCECGRCLRFDPPPDDEEIRCPDCGMALRVPSNTSERGSAAPVSNDDQNEAGSKPALKPLWAMMHKPGEGSSPAAPPDEPVGSDQPRELEPASDAPPARKGLWNLMGAPPVAEADRPSVSPLPSVSAPPAERRKSLWDVMGDRDAAADSPSNAAVETTAPKTSPDYQEFASIPPPGEPPVQHDDPHEVAAPEAPAEAFAGDETDEAEDEAPQQVMALAPGDTFVTRVGHAPPSGRSVKSVIACGLGALALLLSLLALVGGVWSKIPATVFGFGSLLAGFLAMGEIKRSQGLQTGNRLAMTGILAGTLGMFLGPLVFAGLGRHWWQEHNRRFTERHLQRIGEGLNAYYDAKGAFPPGGIFKPREQGDREQGYHGWMTLLLPYLGEEDLYRSIRQDVPYDAPANAEPMGRSVPHFFAAGADPSRVRGKFGVSHFAGLGGAVELDSGGYAQLGIFDVNSKVTHDDVSDGLSNTIVAGEVADEFPAWGDPENWRVVGRGLNRDVQGFGNHDRTGVSFLMADGSVRFFSNKTDPKVLNRLSTRDGGDDPK